VWFVAWVPLATSLLPLPSGRAQLAIIEGEKLTLKIKTERLAPPNSPAAKALAEHEARIERWKRDPSDLERQYWTSWIFALVQLALGLAGSILLLLQHRAWIAFGLISAVWYLLGHFGFFVSGILSLSDLIARIKALSVLPSSLLTVFHFELLLPLLCIWVLVTAVTDWRASPAHDAVQSNS
jgi:hypothetical protein